MLKVQAMPRNCTPLWAGDRLVPGTELECNGAVPPGGVKIATCPARSPTHRTDRLRRTDDQESGRFPAQSVESDCHAMCTWKHTGDIYGFGMRGAEFRMTNNPSGFDHRLLNNPKK